MLDVKLRDAFINQMAKYLPGCKASLKRNAHLNDYDGEDFATPVVEPWLRAFVNTFAEEDNGDTNSVRLAQALCAAAKKFVTTHEPPPVKTTTSDAILVDYANLIVGRYCGLDLAFQTSDLRAPAAPTS